MTPRLVLVAAAAATVLTVGCGSGAAAPSFTAAGAWARPTPNSASDGVVYLTVTTDRADEIVGASVPATVAAQVELHSGGGDGAGGHHHGGGGAADGSGVQTMEQVESFPIAAGGTEVFEPGGDHIMLMNLTAPLERDGTFPLTLRFASGRTLDVTVVVTDNPPG